MVNISKQTPHLLVATGLYPPQIGGPATYAKLLHDELPSYGWEVSVVNFGDVLHLPRGVRHVVYAYRLFKKVRSDSVMFAQDPVSVGVPAWLVAFLTRVPFGIRIAGDWAWEQARQRFGVHDGIDEFQNTRHGLRVGFIKGVQAFVARRADFVVTPSRYFRDIVTGWGVADEKINVVYSGVDLTKIPQCSETPHKKIILSGGRFVPWKGFEGVIDVMALLSDWELWLAGNGPERNHLEAKVKQEGLGDRVLFLGSLKKEEFYEQACEADVFVLNTGYEGLSHMLIEVMYLGLPVITTNIGGNPELITHEKEGFLVEPHNTNEMIKAIHLTENDNIRANLIENARTKVEQFSIQNSFDHLERILRKV